MSRDVPTLHEFLLKQYIAKFPAKWKYVVRLLDHCADTLTSLDVSGCFQVSGAVMNTVISRCPNLRRLNLKNCRKLNDDFLRDLVQYPNLILTELNIGGNFNITDTGIRLFLQQYRNIHALEEFGVSGLDVRDESVLLMARKFTGIKSLQLAYMDVRESTITELLQALGRQLERLDISWPSTTANVKNPQPAAKFLVEVICANCPLLTELDVTANRNLQLPHVQEIIDRKLSMQYAGMGRALEVFYIRFIATPRATLEENLKYPNLKLVCM
eukprot:gene4607-3300_t